MEPCTERLCYHDRTITADKSDQEEEIFVSSFACIDFLIVLASSTYTIQVCLLMSKQWVCKSLKKGLQKIFIVDDLLYKRKQHQGNILLCMEDVFNVEKYCAF